MNERIEEIARSIDPEAWRQCHADDIEWCRKFAELIVKECADNIAGNIDLINPESSYNYGLRRAMKSVKEHFGVEE